MRRLFSGLLAIGAIMTSETLVDALMPDKPPTYIQFNESLEKILMDLHELAVVKLAQKKPLEAASLYERIINLTPNKPHGYIGASTCYIIVQDHENAHNTLDRFLDIKPDSEIAHAYKGIVFLDQEKPEEALDEYAKGGEYGLMETAHYYLNREDYERAKASLRKVSQVETKGDGFYAISMKGKNFSYGSLTTPDFAASVLLAKVDYLETKNVNEARKRFTRLFPIEEFVSKVEVYNLQSPIDIYKEAFQEFLKPDSVSITFGLNFSFKQKKYEPPLFA